MSLLIPNLTSSIEAGGGTTPATWDPSTANSYFWVKSTDFSSAGAITTWNDKSVNAQSGTGTGTVVLNSQNGKPGVSLNGTSDKFTFGTTVIAPSEVPFTIFIVANWSGSAHTTYNGILTAATSGGTANQGWVFTFNAAATDKDFSFGNGYNSTSGRFALTDSSPSGSAHLVTLTFNGTADSVGAFNSSYFTAYDGSILETTSGNGGTSGATTNAPTSIGVINFGAGDYFFGVVYEIVIVPGAYSGTQLTNAQNYFLTGWGIT